MTRCSRSVLSRAPSPRSSPFSSPKAASTALLLALGWCLVAGPSPALADCECGYAATADNSSFVFTDLIETDFSRLTDVGTNTDWVRQAFNVTGNRARGSFGEMFAVDNIYTEETASPSRSSDGLPAGLQLMVGAGQVDGMVPTAEIDSARTDVVWGTYRASMKLTDVAGTCSAFFWYFNDTQEIDMEFLSAQYNASNGSYPVNLVLQSRAAAEMGYDARQAGNFVRAYLPFDPTAGFHEYRVDFLPGRVLFYADDRLLARMEGPAVPDHAGHLVLQHWSNGNPNWSGGPPARDAATTVAYVRAYFNSSLARRQSDWAGRCRDPAAPGAVCQIPDVSTAVAGGAANGSTPMNWFFSDRDNMTNNQTVSGKSEASRGARVSWPMLAAAALAVTGRLLDVW